MMQSECSINTLYQEAQTRWLKPAEVLFILQNHESYQLTEKVPQKPTSGSLFLFNKRVLKFFRKDGHDWRRKKNRRAIAEAHERLKVGNAKALNCYYASGEHDPNFQRRCYWMLDHAYEHIVLVHYRHIREGKQHSGHIVQISPNSSTFIVTPGSSGTQNPSYGESSASSDFEVKQAVQMLEEHLSLNEDSAKEIDPPCSQNENTDDLELLEYEREISEQAQLATVHPRPENNKLERCYGDMLKLKIILTIACWLRRIQACLFHIGSSGKWGDEESASWKHMLESCETSLGLNSEEKPPYFSDRQLCKVQEDSGWHYGPHVNQYPLLLPQEPDSFKLPAYSSVVVKAHDTSMEYYEMMFGEGQIGIPLEQDMTLTVAQKQKFTIGEISPEWGYATETTKVIIIGSFLCDPTESTWRCMFGRTEVPLQIIQEGVICCDAPPHLPGKVTLCITSGNRVSCSEIREFEYQEKSITSCTRCSLFQTPEPSKSPEELLLLVRFVQMLLSDPASDKGNSTESGSQHLLGKLKADDDTWSHVIEAILDGSGTSSGTVDWLLQELLKDKLPLWLSSRSLGEIQLDCSLTKKEQGIIHMVAGLGFEWALNPIVSHGVGVNFRDINGWTALHWAARFGREKMVAALIASGASAGAVTDPNSQDPTGKTAASIATSNGHKGLAGYLSEVALTTHLLSLTLEETETSKGSAQVQAEIAVSSILKPSLPTNEDQLLLKDTLAAVRNAAEAAARIQAAFRAYSFRKRQQREAASAAACVDEYEIDSGDIRGISAMSKLAFGNARDYNSAALSIQKKYRAWKRRKHFLALRRKVVKIQAHVRGYQVRKHYKVICWAVRILDKVVLRWRRKRAGLSGFRQETESGDESEDEDILKVFREQKVYGAVNEAFSRVLSMVDSPDARQQYHRLLERYRQVKAERGRMSETSASDDATLLNDISEMEKDDYYL